MERTLTDTTDLPFCRFGREGVGLKRAVFFCRKNGANSGLDKIVFYLKGEKTPTQGEKYLKRWGKTLWKMV